MKTTLTISTLAASLLLWGCGGPDSGPTISVTAGPALAGNLAVAQTAPGADLNLIDLGGPYLVQEGAFDWKVPETAKPSDQLPSFWQLASTTADGAIFCSGWCREGRCGMDCVNLTEDAATEAMHKPYDLGTPPPKPGDDRDPRL